MPSDPLSSEYWDSFYNDVLGPIKGVGDLQTNALKIDTFRKGTPAITLPNGQIIESTGNRGVDLLNRMFGVSPLAPAQTDVEGEPVSGMGVAGGGFDLGPLIGRVAVIITGFVFVAAGLSMFKPGVTMVAAAKNSMEGIAKNAVL